jgi:peptidoglycan/LPS O-acetylase OafA/YrhL
LSAHPPASYRADIDGLRGIAVLAVMAFHAFPDHLRGGFVGVDVFFVISGYLITGILVSALQRGDFSLAGFYGRRVRRIFPALVLVLMSSLLAGALLLTDGEFQGLGKHVAAAASFTSNLVLLSERGYFDLESDLKPLLHLWSLGVEEQFYLLWPLLLWLAWRLRIQPLLATVLIGGLSFALNIGGVRHEVAAAFYLPQTRFWELLVGAALATLGQPTAKLRLPAWLHRPNLAACAGVLLVAVSLALITPGRRFPGWWATLPTVGAALLIAAGPQALVSRAVLASRPLAWVGRISYPLYLWHWPLLSFIFILQGKGVGTGVRLAALGMAVLLAWLTYMLLEAPIRFGAPSRWKARVLAGSLLLAGSLGYGAWVHDWKGGWKSSLHVIKNQGDLGHQAFLQYHSDHFFPCAQADAAHAGSVWDESVRCYQSRRDRPVNAVLVGDSHAQHLMPGLAQALVHDNLAIFIEHALPVIDNPAFTKFYRHVIEDPQIKTVYLSAYWGRRVSQLPSGQAFYPALERTVLALLAAGKQVYVVEDVPNFSFSPRRCKYENRLLPIHACDEARSDIEVSHLAQRKAFAALKARHPEVVVIETFDTFCDAERCRMATDGVLHFRDANHLSIEGSLFLGRQLLPTLVAVPK